MPSLPPPRRILLADADAFYVAVARMVDPDGAGKEPLLIVGGSRESRGVVCSASYETRKFGVRSAMPISRALRLCPQAVCVPVPRRACSEKSHEIREILERRMVIERLGAAEVEVPFIDAGLFDDRRPAAEYAGDLGALLRAGAAGHWDAHGTWAEPERGADRHGRADAVFAGLVGGRADDAAALGGSAYNQEPGAAGAFRVREPGDSHVERVGVDEQDAARGSRRRHGGSKDRAGAPVGSPCLPSKAGHRYHVPGLYRRGT